MLKIIIYNNYYDYKKYKRTNQVEIVLTDWLVFETAILNWSYLSAEDFYILKYKMLILLLQQIERMYRCG